MRILAICNGSIGGNSEIVLKAALKAAEELVPTVSTSWVHIPSISIPINPKPLTGVLDISLGNNEALFAGQANGTSIPDDREALLNAMLDADAYIFSTPVYSHSPAGFLKGVLDRILGPYTDVVFADETRKHKAAGDPRVANMNIDERLFKPRVAGFICTAGSTTPDQISMAIPMLHTLVYSMHAKVVDQVVFTACAFQGFVVLQEEIMNRAAQLGRNVASQLGKKFDEAQFKGEALEDACPYCYTAKLDYFGTPDNSIGCVTCGALGALKADPTGKIRPVWTENDTVSCITWQGKLNHVYDIQKSTEASANLRDAEFERKLQAWTSVEIQPIDLPSRKS